MKAESSSSQIAAEDFRTAVHEWGHYFAFSAFGINSIPKVLNESERYPLQDGQMAVGHCEPEPIRHDTTPFQKSVIGWAGYMAELIVGCQNPERDLGLPLKAEFLPDCHRAAMCRLETLSRTDQILICGYKSPWVTFKRAFHLLRRQKAKLTRYAKLTTGAEVETTVAVMLPEKFPAALTDFLRLVAAGDKEKFRAFIRATQEKFFAKLPLSPEQRELAIENWTRLRLEFFQQQGFPDAASWRSTATAFAAWNKTKFGSG